MQGRNVVIGALVGMGPNSTSFFYDKVMAYARTLYGAFHDNDFPHIILYSLPTPFIPNQPLDDDAMREALLVGIKALNAPGLGVDYVVIPCNIAHKYYDHLVAHSAVKILNIVEVTLQRVQGSQGPVALLATQSTADCRIYQDRLESKGHAVFHDAHLQALVNDLLKELKAHGVSRQAESLWGALTEYMVQGNECSLAIVACTDLSPCLALSPSIHFVDSSDALARATIETFMRLSSK